MAISYGLALKGDRRARRPFVSCERSMKVAVFSTKPYDRTYLTDANRRFGHALTFFDSRLAEDTCQLAHGFGVVSAFVNDRVNASVIGTLADGGARLVALRCAGFNQVDLAAAAAHGLRVVRVPAYSPYAVADHTLALVLALNRHIPRAVGRVRDGNFSLDGLVGFDLHGKCAGVVGTGRLGAVVVRILLGFGCRVLAFDPVPSDACRELGAEYVTLDALFRDADIVTLHCPLTPASHHMVGAAVLASMKRGAMLINTSRGALVDTRAAIDALKSGHLGALGLDVYEEEADLFFEDLSGEVLHDDVFARLLTFPNVLVTAHQAFFTHEALTDIAETTLENITAFEKGEVLANEVRLEAVVPPRP